MRFFFRRQNKINILYFKVPVILRRSSSSTRNSRVVPVFFKLRLGMGNMCGSRYLTCIKIEYSKSIFTNFCSCSTSLRSGLWICILFFEDPDPDPTAAFSMRIRTQLKTLKIIKNSNSIYTVLSKTRQKEIKKLTRS